MQLLALFSLDKSFNLSIIKTIKWFAKKRKKCKKPSRDNKQIGIYAEMPLFEQDIFSTKCTNEYYKMEYVY